MASYHQGWGWNWDPGLATGHTVRPAAGVNHPAHTYSQRETSILLRQRGKQDEAVGAVCVHESCLQSVRLAMGICVWGCGYVVYILPARAQPH